MKLSLPPSVNKMFANTARTEPPQAAPDAKASGRKVRGRVKSKAYLAWLRTAAMELFQFGAEARRIKREGGNYAATIRLPVNYSSDIDNRVKPLLDLLVAHGILSDDSRVDALHVYRDQTLDAATLKIATQYEPAPALTATCDSDTIEWILSDVRKWGEFLSPAQVRAAIVALGLDGWQ